MVYTCIGAFSSMLVPVMLTVFKQPHGFLITSGTLWLNKWSSHKQSQLKFCTSGILPWKVSVSWINTVVKQTEEVPREMTHHVNSSFSATMRELSMCSSFSRLCRAGTVPNMRRAGSLGSMRCTSMGVAPRVSTCLCLHAAFCQRSGSLLHKSLIIPWILR